jgi:molybdate transport repressor ModE-like protein
MRVNDSSPRICMLSRGTSLLSCTVDLTNMTNTGSIRIDGRVGKQGATTLAAARLTLRVDLGEDRAVGPGKIRLLEAIRDTGSITKAGIALGMSYRRAWLLVDDMNNCFREPVVAAQAGGTHGGGAALTPFGATLIDQYRAIEA